jgi:hypothetical protein
MKIIITAFLIFSLPLLLLTQEPPDNLEIYQFDSAPRLDGLPDPGYGPENPIGVQDIDNNMELWGGPSDLSARFRAGWLGDYLYFLIDVTDDVFDTSEEGEDVSYQNDAIEFFFDGDNSKIESSLDIINDIQIRIERDDQGPGHISVGNPRVGGTPDWFDTLSVHYVTVEKPENGYLLEVGFPIDQLRLTGDASDYFGFDVQLDDADGEYRETMLRWHANSNDEWHWYHLLGNARRTGTRVSESAPDNLVFYPLSSAPRMDCVADIGYGPEKSIAILDTGDNPNFWTGPADLSASFRTGWYGDSIYLFIDITDQVLDKDDLIEPWQNDAVEIYFDGDNSKLESTADLINDSQLRIERDKDLGHMIQDAAHMGGGYLDWYDSTYTWYLQREKEGDGYIIEARFSIEDLRIVGDENGYFGFDIQINDADNRATIDGLRENIMRWHTNCNEEWHWAHLLGNATLYNFSDYSLNQSIDFPQNSKGSDYKASDYRIFGLPGGGGMLLGNLFSGTRDKDWQVYWDNGEASDFLVEYDGSDRFRSAPGRAFWVLNKGTLQIDLQDVSPAPLNNHSEVEIEVHHRWNLITNPFPQPIEWARVQEINHMDIPLYSYDGSFNSGTQTLEPYQGYYFDNDTDPPLTVLRIPFDPVINNLPKQVIINEYNWKIGITLQHNEIIDKNCYLAVKADAKPGLDKNEFCLPRAPGLIPAVFFYRPQWDEAYPSFANDVRPLFEEEIEEWDFQVQIPSPAPSTLSFSGLEDIPAQFAVFLINNSNTACINLREKDAYDFTPQAEVSSFSVVVGKEYLVHERLKNVIPNDFSLSQNFPNPFNPGTTIPFALPSRSRITINVYNIMGQKVKTLVNGTMDAGKHQVSWDGKDERGIKVSSGLYIYQMKTAKGKNFSSKMLLLK